ncbi:MAG: hypothetical protein ACRCYX_09675 [Dermatophilaceae bacterium]
MTQPPGAESAGAESAGAESAGAESAGAAPVDGLGRERSLTASQAVATAGADVVPPEARRELDRLRRRWSELPAARAADAAPPVRNLVTDLAARASPGCGPPADLGLATLIDQLTVLVWDAYALGCADDLPGRLIALRRVLP